MKPYTNNSNIHLCLAVWLARDSYDYNPDPMVVSATRLIRPLRQIILGSRNQNKPTNETDIASFIASRMGTALHDSVERAWNEETEDSLLKLGYPEDVINKMAINPDKHDPNKINIYLENRDHRKLGDYTISGKYDFVSEGQVQDIKSTGTYGYMKGDTNNYILQGSIYRWISPEIITEDSMLIHYIFTNWSKLEAMKNREYPQTRVLSITLPLMSLTDTQNYITKKLADVEKYKNSPDRDIPLCTKKDLWMDDPIWAYYKNPANTERSTKNFTSVDEANLRLIKDGNVGIVVKRNAKAKACNWCPALGNCQQAQNLIRAGLLDLD